MNVIHEYENVRTRRTDMKWLLKVHIFANQAHDQLTNKIYHRHEIWLVKVSIKFENMFYLH